MKTLLLLIAAGLCVFFAVYLWHSVLFPEKL